MPRIRFALVLALLLVVSTSAFAVGGIKTIYYTNANFTTSVGGEYYPDWDCPPEDLWWRWGSRSAYEKEYIYSDCEEGGTVTVTCYANGSVVTCP